MSTPNDARPLVLPQLRYERPAEAIAWLVRVFGFVEQSRMSGPDGTVSIAEGRCWNFSQHLRETTPEEWGAKRTNP